MFFFSSKSELLHIMQGVHIRTSVFYVIAKNSKNVFKSLEIKKVYILSNGSNVIFEDILLVLSLQNTQTQCKNSRENLLKKYTNTFDSLLTDEKIYSW